MSTSLAVMDVALTRLWIVGDLSTPQVLALHAAAVAAVGGIALALRWRDRVRIMSSLLMALLFGPVGGFVLLIAELGRGGTRSPAARPLPQGAPPSQAELLHAEILQGRRRRADAAVPQPFAETFASGALTRQQDAIAAISLSYRPEMLPALRLALASEVPALRVQAAAVYAKLRGSFGERAKVVRAAAQEGRLGPELAAEAAAVAASGFVDDETVAELKAHAARTPAPSAAAAPRRKDELLRAPRLGRHASTGVA